MDQFLAKGHSSSSSTFLSVKSKREIDYKLENITTQLNSLSATLSSSQSPNGSRYNHGSRGRGGGHNTGGRGKKNVAFGIVEEIITFFNALSLS